MRCSLFAVVALVSLWCGAHAQCNENEQYTMLCQKVKQIAILSNFASKLPCPAFKGVVQEVADVMISYQNLTLKQMGDRMATYVMDNLNNIISKAVASAGLNSIALGAAGADLMGKANSCQKTCKTTTDGLKDRYSACMVKTLQPAYKTLKQKFTNWVKNKFNNDAIRCECYKYARSALTQALIKQGVKFCKPNGCACEWNLMASALGKYGQVPKYDDQSITVPDKPCN